MPVSVRACDDSVSDRGLAVHHVGEDVAHSSLAQRERRKDSTVSEAERAIVIERLSEAQDEAMRVQLALEQISRALARAEEAGDGPAMARWYAQEAALLHRRAEIADHVSAIAAVLWTPQEPLVTEQPPIRIVH